MKKNNCKGKLRKHIAAAYIFYEFGSCFRRLWKQGIPSFTSSVYFTGKHATPWPKFIALLNGRFVLTGAPLGHLRFKAFHSLAWFAIKKEN